MRNGSRSAVPVSAIKGTLGCWAVVAHTFVPVLRRQRPADLCEFEVSLIYRVSSSTFPKANKNRLLLSMSYMD